MKFRLSSSKQKLEQERLANAKLQADLAAARQREIDRQAYELAEAQKREQIKIYEQIQRENYAREIEEARRREEQWRHQEATRRRLEKEEEEREEHHRRLRQKKMKNASPETLQSLRELIRTRYQLDVEIWNLRGVRKPDQPLVVMKMDKADDVLNEIMAIVNCWTENVDGHWTAEEWERVKDIQRRLRAQGKRNWAANPPWADKGPLGR